MSRDSPRCVILTKVPGFSDSKSRLASSVGQDAATALSSAFLLDTVALCDEAYGNAMIAFTPPGGGPWLARLFPRRTLVPQAPGDLGARIRAALSDALTGGSGAILVGSDSPDLPVDTMRSAAEALASHELAIGPALDGGFTLIAAAAPPPTDLFEGVSWSTNTVLDTVLTNARRLRLSVRLLAPAADVDDLPGLRALAGRLRGSHRCPETRRTLADLAEAGRYRL